MVGKKRFLETFPCGIFRGEELIQSFADPDECIDACHAMNEVTEGKPFTPRNMSDDAIELERSERSTPKRPNFIERVVNIFSNKP